MTIFQIKPSAFVELAKKNCLNPTERSFDKEYRHFRAHFGISPITCAILWKKLVDNAVLPQGRKPVHLLWALYFLNRYETEEVAASTFGVDEETYRKWYWKLVVAIAKLKPSVVSLEVCLCWSLLSGCILLHISQHPCQFFLPFSLLPLVPVCRTDQVVESASQGCWSIVQGVSRWN